LNNYGNCRHHLSLSVDKNSPESERNYGVKVALGEIIAFVDADCVPEKSWLENLIKYFSRNIMVVGCSNIHTFFWDPEDQLKFRKSRNSPMCEPSLLATLLLERPCSLRLVGSMRS
jgi:Glycosyl transferase family 2